MLPVPEDCANASCEAILRFRVFGANLQRSVLVRFSSMGSKHKWHEDVIAATDDVMSVRVPMSGSVRQLLISVPDAISPRALVNLPDARVLGISLRRIDILKN